MEATLTQEITTPTRGEQLPPAPETSKPQKRQFGAVIFGLLSALGLGVAVGTNMHRLADLDQSAAWLQQAASLVQSGFEAARSEVGSRIASFTSNSTSVPEATERAAWQGPSRDETVARMVGDLSRQVDQVRAADEVWARELDTGIERVRSLTEHNHREIVAKLAQLAERMERVERQATAATAPAPTQPGVTQPVVQATPTSPPPKLLAKSVAKPIPKPVSNAKAKATPKPTPTVAKPDVPDMDAKGIANWTVLSVSDGTAALKGPRGIIEVTVGDTIPGIGQIQAIMRSGGRWVVATSKGVITARKRVPYPEASADEW